MTRSKGELETCLLQGRCVSRCFLRVCRPDQIKAELKTCLRMLDEVYTTFGLSYKMALSTRPEKRLGDEALWDSAEGALTEAMDETGLEWEVGTLLQSAGDLFGSSQRPWNQEMKSTNWTRQGCSGSLRTPDCQWGLRQIWRCVLRAPGHARTGGAGEAGGEGGGGAEERPRQMPQPGAVARGLAGACGLGN